MMLKRLLLCVSLLGILTSVLTGHEKLQPHITINRDGSADVEYITAWCPNGGYHDYLLDNSYGSFVARQSNGFRSEDYKSGDLTGIRLYKHIDDASDLSSTIFTQAFGQFPRLTNGSGGACIFTDIMKGLSVDRSFLTTTYSLDSTISLAHLKKSTFDLSFVVTFPTMPKKTNAPKMTNWRRTLEWPIQPGTENRFQAEVTVLNTKNCMTTGAGALGVLVIVAAMVLKGKKRKKALVEDPEMHDDVPSSESTE